MMAAGGASERANQNVREKTEPDKLLGKDRFPPLSGKFHRQK